MSKPKLQVVKSGINYYVEEFDEKSSKWIKVSTLNHNHEKDAVAEAKQHYFRSEEKIITWTSDEHMNPVVEVDPSKSSAKPAPKYKKIDRAAGKVHHE